MKTKHKIIGILGGMGPAATQDLYNKIIYLTPAKCDQEHLRVFIDVHPQIPDRTAALFNDGECPVPYMLESARKLEKAGADFIIIPCNTAHAYIDKIQIKINIPILSIIKTCVKQFKETHPQISKIGILATTGTIRSSLYQKEFKKYGVNTVIPNTACQELVMKSIYGVNGIKAGIINDETVKRLEYVTKALIENGAEIILMACTEIPLALKQGNVNIPLIDPTEILAAEAVREAYGKIK